MGDAWGKLFSRGDVQATGGQDKHYVHTQSIASSEWIVIHNLGKQPSVTVIDSGHNMVFGDVEYIDQNSLVITFSAPFGGEALLN